MLRRRFMQRAIRLATMLAAGQATAGSAQGAYVVHGFRSAAFGMHEAELRAAIERDFATHANALTPVQNPTEGSTALVLRLPSLEPGPGPATVSYVFGAASHRLANVHVVWLSAPEPGQAERDSFAVAGSQLAAYFRRLPWGPRATAAPSPAGDAGLVLFAGVDARGAGAEVRIIGIQTVGPHGKDGPTPRGPTQLRVAYFANVLQPDVRHSPAATPSRGRA